jgi:haloalkane dehalogenase
VARRFATLFPHSELHLLPDAGHYVQVDEPQRVAPSSPSSITKL